MADQPLGFVRSLRSMNSACYWADDCRRIRKRQGPHLHLPADPRCPTSSM